jgi:hypothetical protein
MKKYILPRLTFFSYTILDAAIFTIENYTGGEITTQLLLDKSWGSTSKEVKIPYGKALKFNTGIYGVAMNGIQWSDADHNFYTINGIAIKPLSIGLVLRLYKESYEWMKTAAFFDYLASGGFPQGFGTISKESN